MKRIIRIIATLALIAGIGIGTTGCVPHACIPTTVGACQGGGR